MVGPCTRPFRICWTPQPDVKLLKYREFNGPKKLRPAFGGRLAARDPVWDGEGWGCDRVACPVDSWFRQRSLALAVATAGRLSPSETHTFGSLCD